jgi:hypothetical protein
VLDRVRAGALADAGERHLARVAVERRRAQLDQLVVRKRAVDLGDHRVGEALFAQLQDGMQGMGARLERLARPRCEHSGFSARFVHVSSSATQNARAHFIVMSGCFACRTCGQSSGGKIPSM